MKSATLDLNVRVDCYAPGSEEPMPPQGALHLSAHGVGLTGSRTVPGNRHSAEERG